MSDLKHSPKNPKHIAIIGLLVIAIFMSLSIAYLEENLIAGGIVVVLLLALYLFSNFLIQSKNLDDQFRESVMAIAGHQMRTPLTAIKWTTELLIGESKNMTPSQVATLNDIFKFSQLMNYTISSLEKLSLMDGTKLEVRPKATDFQELFGVIDKEMSPRISGRGLKFEHKIGKIPKIMIDQSLIYQAIRNLLVNATKYNRDNGNVNLNASWKKDTLTITVSDTGIGIPSKEEKKIWKRFYKASNNPLKEDEGLGLGLFIVETIVKACKGKTSLETSPKGSEFTISIPATRASAE